MAKVLRSPYAIISKIYTVVPHCRHSSKKKVTFYNQKCFLRNGEFDFLTLTPYTLNNAQYGHTSDNKHFRKEGQIWNQIPAPKTTGG